MENWGVGWEQRGLLSEEMCAGKATTTAVPYTGNTRLLLVAGAMYPLSHFARLLSTCWGPATLLVGGGGSLQCLDGPVTGLRD